MSITFGEKMRAARELRQMTQAEVARRMGIDKAYFNKIERGMAPPPSRGIIDDWLNELGIQDPKERLQYLLVAGQVGYDDVAKIAEGLDLEHDPRVAAIYALVDSLPQGTQEPAKEDVIEDLVGVRYAAQLPRLREVFANAHLSREQSVRVVDELITLATSLVRVAEPETSES